MGSSCIHISLVLCPEQLGCWSYLGMPLERRDVNLIYPKSSIHYRPAAIVTSPATQVPIPVLTAAATAASSATPTPAPGFLQRLLPSESTSSGYSLPRPFRPLLLNRFTLSASDGLDYYDVSLVDGYNLPVSITSSAGFHVADCPVDLGPNCPAGLQGPFDSTGFPVGCKSDCLVDSNPGNSPSCCSGSYNTPATCPSSGVPHYTYFKSNCPNSYVYGEKDLSSLLETRTGNNHVSLE
jgi:hypothetical protein